jgi:putative exosortase-associated protein (TIGR04073 family)
MKKSVRRAVGVLCLSFFIGGCSSTVWVDRPDESPVYRGPRKLARGVVNMVSGPFEIFNQPIRLAEKEDRFLPQVAGLVAGIPVGIGYGIGRIFAGAFDIVTAPILVPEQSLVSPEFMSPNFLDWAFYY